MIKPMDYARVVSAKKLKGSGLQLGALVMVLGTKLVPGSSKDPYLHRALVTVARVENDLPVIPKDGDDEQVWLVDPRSLEKVSEKEGSYLASVLEDKFGSAHNN